jgi:hypothetical protein
MARLYANENFPLPVVENLRQLGHDVLTVQETGTAGQAWPDEAVLSFALSQDRVLLIHNRRHFLRLHAAGTPHAGIVACTVDANFSGQAERIHRALSEQVSWNGQIVRINRPTG